MYPDIYASATNLFHCSLSLAILKKENYARVTIQRNAYNILKSKTIKQ